MVKPYKLYATVEYSVLINLDVHADSLEAAKEQALDVLPQLAIRKIKNGDSDVSESIDVDENK